MSNKCPQCKQNGFKYDEEKKWWGCTVCGYDKSLEGYLKDYPTDFRHLKNKRRTRQGDELSPSEPDATTEPVRRDQDREMEPDGQ